MRVQPDFKAPAGKTRIAGWATYNGVRPRGTFVGAPNLRNTELQGGSERKRQFIFTIQ